MIGILVYGQINQQQDRAFRQNLVNEEEDNKATIRNNITSYVTAERNEYTYSKLGGIYNLQISVTNNTDYIIDKARVKVTYIKSNGGVWETRYVDFDLIGPQIKKTIKVPDTERGTTINYEIVSIKSNA